MTSGAVLTGALSPQAFNDITSGTNPGCNTNGFSASKGWDPVCRCYECSGTRPLTIMQVTGMGSPNFAAMRTALGI
jgi:tripeptidyl-peptidase-1